MMGEESRGGENARTVYPFSIEEERNQAHTRTGSVTLSELTGKGKWKGRKEKGHQPGWGKTLIPRVKGGKHALIHYMGRGVEKEKRRINPSWPRPKKGGAGPLLHIFLRGGGGGGGGWEGKKGRGRKKRLCPMCCCVRRKRGTKKSLSSLLPRKGEGACHSPAEKKEKRKEKREGGGYITLRLPLITVSQRGPVIHLRGKRSKP